MSSVKEAKGVANEGEGWMREAKTALVDKYFRRHFI